MPLEVSRSQATLPHCLSLSSSAMHENIKNAVNIFHFSFKTAAVAAQQVGSMIPYAQPAMQLVQHLMEAVDKVEKNKYVFFSSVDIYHYWLTRLTIKEMMRNFLRKDADTCSTGLN